MHFNTHPVTPDMGLRQSIDAMLAHVAYNGRDFGYLPSAVHVANYHDLLEDFRPLLATDGDTLTLAPVISDSAELAYLVEILLGLCNDYPAYNDESYSKIETARLVETINESRTDDMPTADAIARAIFENGSYVEQSEYGAWVSDADFHAAVETARNY